MAETTCAACRLLLAPAKVTVGLLFPDLSDVPVRVTIVPGDPCFGLKSLSAGGVAGLPRVAVIVMIRCEPGLPKKLPSIVLLVSSWAGFVTEATPRFSWLVSHD